MVWPAIILAANLTAKLIGLDIYETISIGTNIGIKNIGTPFGRKSLKYLWPCNTKPKIVANKNTPNASAKVIIIWLVTVKLYGINPNILHNKININKVYTKGNNLLPSLPKLDCVVL